MCVLPECVALVDEDVECVGGAGDDVEGLVHLVLKLRLQCLQDG